MTTPTLATLVAIEARRATRQPATWVLGAILLAYLLVIIVSFSSILGMPEVEGFDKDMFLLPLRQDALAYTASLFQSTALILLVVFAAQSVGQEFSRGTLRTLLLSGATRGRIAGAKLALLAIMSLALTLLGLLAAVVGALAFGAVIGEDLLKWGSMGAPDILAALAGRALALLVSFALWGAIAFAATLWSRSLGVGIGVVIGLLIVGDIITGLIASAGEIGEWATRIMPNAAAAALASPRAPAASDWLWLGPNLAAYLVALPWFAVARFRRIDALAATKQ